MAHSDYLKIRIRVVLGGWAVVEVEGALVVEPYNNGGLSVCLVQGVRSKNRRHGMAVTELRTSGPIFLEATQRARARCIGHAVAKSDPAARP